MRGRMWGRGRTPPFKQMAAEAVGVPFEMVETIYSDTAETGDSGSASASRLTWMAGNAILGAAERALSAWQNEERPARGHFRFTPPATEMLDEATGKGQPNFTYGYVAQAVELAVDIETGHIWVERVINASDVGKIVNRNLIEGQVEGCVVQAHGYAITEKLRLKDGHIVNPRLSSYLIPRHSGCARTGRDSFAGGARPAGAVGGARGGGDALLALCASGHGRAPRRHRRLVR